MTGCNRRIRGTGDRRPAIDTDRLASLLLRAARQSLDDTETTADTNGRRSADADPDGKHVDKDAA